MRRRADAVMEPGDRQPSDGRRSGSAIDSRRRLAPELAPLAADATGVRRLDAPSCRSAAMATGRAGAVRQSRAAGHIPPDERRSDAEAQRPVAAARPRLHRRRLDRGGEPQGGPQSGQRRADRRSRRRRRRRRARGDRRRGGGVSRLVGQDRARALGDPARVESPDARQRRRSRAHPDRRDGQAVRRGAGRDPLWRELRRMVRAGGAAGLRRRDSRPSRRQAHPRPQAADRRRGGDHAVEFPQRDDRAQGRAGAGGRLHVRLAPGRADAAVGAGDGGARRARRHSRRRLQRRHQRRRFRRRPGILRQPESAQDLVHRLDARRLDPDASGRRRRSRSSASNSAATRRSSSSTTPISTRRSKAR